MKRRVNMSFDVDDKELIDESFLKVFDDHVKTVARERADKIITDAIDSKIQKATDDYIRDSWNFNRVCDRYMTEAVRKAIEGNKDTKEQFEKELKQRVPIIIERYLDTSTIGSMVKNALQVYVTELVKKQLDN